MISDIFLLVHTSQFISHLSQCSGKRQERNSTNTSQSQRELCSTDLLNNLLVPVEATGCLCTDRSSGINNCTFVVLPISMHGVGCGRAPPHGEPRHGVTRSRVAAQEPALYA